MTNDITTIGYLRIEKPEGTLIDGTGNAGNRVGSSLAGGTLLHPLGSDLQLGLAEVIDHPLSVNA